MCVCVWQIQKYFTEEKSYKHNLANKWLSKIKGTEDTRDSPQNSIALAAVTRQTISESIAELILIKFSSKWMKNEGIFPIHKKNKLLENLHTDGMKS